MQYIDMVGKNTTESLVTGLVGAVGSRMIWGNQLMWFGNTPVLDYLNNYNAMYLYFAIFGLANVGLSYTGDFMSYLFGSPQISKLGQLSRPSTVGVLAVGLIFLTNGFSISMSGALYAFLLGATSNIIGQWSADMLISSVHPLLQNTAILQNNPPSFSGGSSTVVSNPPKPYTPNGFNFYSGPVNPLFGLNGF